MTLAVFASKAYVHYLECSDMERHLDAFLSPTFNHRGHNTHGRTNDLRHVLGKAELEVLDKVGDDGLHLNNTVVRMSHELLDTKN